MKYIHLFFRLTLICALVLLVTTCQDEQIITDYEPDAELPQLKSATNANSLTDLIISIEALVNDGTLNKGIGNSLIKKINNALKSLNQDKNGAIGQLNALINQVDDLIGEEVLPEEEGLSLISTVESEIILIEGNFEPENSFLKINNEIYSLSKMLHVYYGNFEGKGVYNHTVYLISPDHNFNPETLTTNGTGAVLSFEIFNTKENLENGTYIFSLPEIMNTELLCDGTDTNGDGIVNDDDCVYTMPDGGSYISSNLSVYDSNADLYDLIGLKFESGNVKITTGDNYYLIEFDCIGSNGDVITGYYAGQFHYYDIS